MDLDGGLGWPPVRRAFFGWEVVLEGGGGRFTFCLFLVMRSSVWPAQLQSSSQMGQSMSSISSTDRRSDETIDTGLLAGPSALYVFLSENARKMVRFTAKATVKAILFRGDRRLWLGAVITGGGGGGSRGGCGKRGRRIE